MIVKMPTSSRRARSRWWHSPQQYQQDPDESGLLHHRDATAAASLDLGLLPLLASEVPLGGNKPSARGHGITSRSDLFDKPARRRKGGPTGLELWGGRLAMTGRVLRPGRAIDDLVCLECILGVSPGMVEAADRIRSV
jgi:hypothetical protein